MPNPDGEGWMRLGDLHPGALFRTKNGWDCFLSRRDGVFCLDGGDNPCLPEGDDTLVKEIVIRSSSSYADPIAHPLDVDLVVFDLDGTLRRCKEHRGPCHNDPGRWEIIPGTEAILDQYDWTRVGFGLATNQAGIALGYTTAQRVEEELYKTICALFRDWPMMDHVAGSYQAVSRRHRMPERGSVFRYASAAPDASSIERKPSPWMVLDLVRTYGERLDRTLFVGDSPEDQQAAERAGVRFLWAWQFFHRREDTPYLGWNEA